MKDWPYPRYVAHRGGGKLAPENTLAAMREGYAHGYRMVEFDVKLSADGVPFLLHDDTLDRTTDGAGRADALPWAELSKLDAGSWHSAAYAGEPLPTLSAIARWAIANGAACNIEIKPASWRRARYRDGGRARSARAVARRAGATPVLVVCGRRPRCGTRRGAGIAAGAARRRGSSRLAGATRAAGVRGPQCGLARAG